MADSDVKLKHKVQLRKKVEETKPVSEPGLVDPQPKQPRRNSKIWLWIFSIIVIGLLIWWIIASIRTENKTVEAETQTPTVEEVIEQPETVEEGTEVPAVSEEQLSEETSPTDVQETRPLTPIPSSTTEEPSVPVQSQRSKSSPTTTQSQSNASINISNDVEAEAMKVIRGDYGNNPIRRKNLGPKYREIQKRVNEMKRKGKF